MRYERHNKNHILDFLHRLHEEIDILPAEDINYFIAKINNMISWYMNWEDTYLIKYNKDDKSITIFGFPPQHYRRLFIQERQAEWVTRKLGYAQCVIRRKHQDYISVTFLLTEKFKNKVVVTCDRWNGNLEDDYVTNCNVLSDNQ